MPLTVDDEREITAVLVRYASGIDTRDWPLFRTCFADEISAEYGPFGAWTSGDAITASMEEMHAVVGPTLHRVSNVVISQSDGGAQVRSYIDALLMPKSPEDPVHRAAGFYDDRFLKTGRGWKIERRVFTAVRLV